MQVQERAITLMDAVFPRTMVQNILLVLFFAGVTALSAQLSVKIGWVPITGQTFAVLLAGALLGSKRGAVSQITYLAVGAMGAPIFANYMGGPGVFAGPTGGYLIGFIPAAFVVGLLAERGWDRRVWTTILAMFIGSVVLYTFGLSWLSIWLSRFNPDSSVIGVGLVPFLPGDALKIALAAVALPYGWARLNRNRK